MLLDVWTYEAYRLFCDRLVNRESSNKFEAIIADVLKTSFKYEVKLTSLYYTTLKAPDSGAPDLAKDDKHPSLSDGDTKEKKSDGNQLSDGDAKEKKSGKDAAATPSKEAAAEPALTREIGAVLDRMSSKVNEP